MKAILVIDMPNECNECPLQDGEKCYARQDWISTISDWRCPLKQLPEKQEHKRGLCSDFILGFEDGWNGCLEEILDDRQS